MSVPTPFHPPFQPGDKVPSSPHSNPVPPPVPSNPLIPPGVGTPALSGREPTATPPAVAVEPRIVTAPSGEQQVVYQARDGRIRVERIHPVEPPPSHIWGPEF
jgi:hypothetical protein